jgi:hypothetical protein
MVKKENEGSESNWRYTRISEFFLFKKNDLNKDILVSLLFIILNFLYLTSSLTV